MRITHDRGVASRPGTASRSCVLALALMLSGPVLGAGFACSGPTVSGGNGALEELQEVVVTAAQATTGTRDLRGWLKLLVGQYTYEGYVDLCGKGIAEDRRPVTGEAHCAQSGSTPNVLCTVNVRWPEARGEDGLPVPGGESNLVPALLSFGLEKRHLPDPGGGEAAFRAALRTGTPMAPARTGYWGLMFTQLDNRGIVEWGSGVLVGNTFTSTEPCVSIGVAGNCQKITRITARPGSSEIAMLVDIRIDSRRVLRQEFLLRRQPDIP